MSGTRASGTPASGTPAHDLLGPRLAALLDEAARAGIDRETAIAVMLDILETGLPAPKDPGRS